MNAANQYANFNEADAHARVRDARAGYAVDASETYLVALRAGLLRWIADIDANLAARDYARVSRLERAPASPK